METEQTRTDFAHDLLSVLNGSKLAAAGYDFLAGGYAHQITVITPERQKFSLIVQHAGLRALPSTQTRTDTYRLSERRTLQPGTVVSLRGQRGRFVFKYADTSVSTGEVSLTFTGPKGFRSVRPEAVRTIHRPLEWQRRNYPGE